MSFFEYLRKDLKLSAKTVKSEYPRYICFAVVLLLVSMLIFTVSTLNYNHQKTQRDYLESRYVTKSGDVYHFEMANLTEGQYLLVLQFAEEQVSNNKIFKIVEAKESPISGTHERRYDLYILLLHNIDTSFDVFVDRYTEQLNEESKHYAINKTPLLDFEISVVQNTIIYILLLVLIVAAGATALWVLHSTMINHYKFAYGIYMTFGANFWRLFLTAMWEQFWILLITFLPSSLIGLLVSWIVFKQTGLAFTIYWLGFLWTFLLALLTVGIAVFVSIRATSAKTPAALIVAADNSNYIHSPRTSFDLIGAKFPDTIGRLTYRRYRKYIVRLMAGTLAFSMLFVAASTVAFCYDRVLALDEPEISVKFDIPVFIGEAGETTTDYSSYGYDTEKSELFHQLDGIKTISKRAHHHASSVCSHVKIDRSIPHLFSGGVNIDGITGDDKCFLNVDYNALDEELIATFNTLGYEIEGSLESVIENEKTIAVTEGYLGAKRFDWKVGDTVRIADLPEEDLRDRLNGIAGTFLITDYDNLLSAWLRESAFSYTEYTVGAIISEIPTDQNWGIYFSAKDYKSVTGYEPTYNELEIYAADDATQEEISFIYNELREAADFYTNMMVTDLDTATAKTIQENKNYTSIITMVSVVLLSVCPLIWFFSQALFYQKRQGEVELFQAMGASTASIKRYLLGDAIRFALTGGLLFTVLAPLVSWGIHRLVGYIMIFAGGTMLASFQLPIIPYTAGILLNLICGFISVFAAMRGYFNRRPAIYKDTNSVGLTDHTNENKEASV